MVITEETLNKIGASVKASVPKIDPSIGTILVTAGDGVVAYRVALELVAAGYPKVRVGVSDPTSLPDLQRAGASIVKFDWDAGDTYANALEGVRSVFVAMPHHPNWQNQFDTFIQTAKKAGVKHFVKLSFVHALNSKADNMVNFCTAINKQDPFLKVPLIAMHRECDAHLMKLPHGINYTILFASHFMSNATVYQGEQIRTNKSFAGASGGHAVNYVSPNDVADVAVHALLCPKKHHRVGYNLTGAKAIMDTEIASALSAELGAKITYKDLAIKDYCQAATGTDWGPAVDVAYLEFLKASGEEEDPKFVSHDIDRVCGHPAEKYEQYLAKKELMSPRELSCLNASITA